MMLCKSIQVYMWSCDIEYKYTGVNVYTLS